MELIKQISRTFLNGSNSLCLTFRITYTVHYEQIHYLRERVDSSMETSFDSVIIRDRSLLSFGLAIKTISNEKLFS